MNAHEIIICLGGPGAIARYLGITSPAVSQWRNKNRIPAARVSGLVALSRKLQCPITPVQMRPDIFGES
jgi:DNA-binding transcriptional regulator YdaS (Cro superfamily)